MGCLLPPQGLLLARESLLGQEVFCVMGCLLPPQGLLLARERLLGQEVFCVMDAYCLLKAFYLLERGSLGL